MRWHRPSAPVRLALLPALFGALVVVGVGVGQPPPGPGIAQPRLHIATPNGGKVGTTFDMSLVGTELEQPEQVIFSHPGIKAELSAEPPEKVDPKNPPKKPKNQPGAMMTVKCKVTVAADVPLGLHDVRLATKYGVSNPRAFAIGDLTEVMEKEPNNDVEQAQRVEMNSTINGVIQTPTDVDYYVFKGAKGQRVVVSCQASSIESRLEPAIELYDAAGKKLAANRDYHGHDALLDAVLPNEGDYHVRVFQFTHTQGTTEHYYRLSISTAPWIDAVFPPVVEPGKPATLTVYGRNLPGGQPDPNATVNGSVLEKATVQVNVPNDPVAVQRLAYRGHLMPASSWLDGFEYRMKNGSGSSNAFLLGFSRAPVVLDTGKNLTRESAQALTLPCEVAGRLETNHNHAWYTFTAKKGDVVSIELLGERIGAPLDLALALYNGDAKNPMVELDDVQPNDPESLSINQFFTRTSDPARYRLVVPADGKFQVLVKSQEGTHRAGPRQLYRLRVTPEQPDFRLVVMPTSTYQPDACILRQGSDQDYTVFVWRRDGFNEDIALTVDGLPPGVTAKPQVAGPALKQVPLVLNATADAAAWTGPITVKGTATLNGQQLVREARCATITWPGNPQQNQTPWHTRLDQSLVLAVRDKAPFSVTLALDKTTAPQGEKVTIPVGVQRHWPDFKTPVSVQALGLPTGVTFNNNNAPMAVANDTGSLVLTVGPTAVPGTYTIAFRATAQVPFSKDLEAKQKPNVNIALASTPITLTILPKQLATVTVTPPNANAKLGAPAKFTVKVARQFGFQGEFKVAVVLPPNAKGITAPEVTIPAGKDEAELVLTVAADAPVGNLANIVVRATAMFNGNVPVTQEAKFSLNVAK